MNEMICMSVAPFFYRQSCWELTSVSCNCYYVAGEEEANWSTVTSRHRITTDNERRPDCAI
jgi:hypothetical protein